MKVDDIHRKVRVGGDQGAGDLCVLCRELWPCETIVALKREREESEGSIDHLRECADGSARRAEQWAAKCDRLIAERDDIRTQLAASEQANARWKERWEKARGIAERAEAERDRLADWKACILVAASYSGNMKLSKAIERADDAARDGEGGIAAR